MTISRPTIYSAPIAVAVAGVFESGEINFGCGLGCRIRGWSLGVDIDLDVGIL